FRYRYNGKPQDLALGVYPIVTLSEAREEAIKCKKLLSDGQDPKLERQLKKMKVLEAVTVQDALEHWLTVDASKSRANFEKHRAQFKKHIYPFIGSIPL
ncbi:Arm DNA-binding domain-containing protein, partial [Vibrio sp. 10N.222.49.C9]